MKHYSINNEVEKVFWGKVFFVLFICNMLWFRFRSSFIYQGT